MLKILKPLEIGASNATSVDEKIWGTDNASLDEDLLSSVGRWAICTFKNSFNLNLLSVAFVKRLFNCSRYKIVCFLFEEKLWSCQFSFNGTWESLQGAMLGHVIFDFLNVESIWIVDRGVVLNHCCDDTTFLFQKL